jgi:hypothetical protein
VRISQILYRKNESAKRNRAHLKRVLRLAPFSNDLTKLATALTKDSRAKHFSNLNWKRPFLSKSRYMCGLQCSKKLWHPVQPFAARRNHQPRSTPAKTAQADPQETFAATPARS